MPERMRQIAKDKLAILPEDAEEPTGKIIPGKLFHREPEEWPAGTRFVDRNDHEKIEDVRTENLEDKDLLQVRTGDRDESMTFFYFLRTVFLQRFFLIYFIKPDSKFFKDHKHSNDIIIFNIVHHENYDIMIRHHTESNAAIIF
jgi:hypothetical protein